MECAASSQEEMRDLLSFDLSEDALKKRISKLAISADAKSILFTISKQTIRVGAMVVKIGRKVLDVVITILTEYPMAITGVVFGAVFGEMVKSIPLFGLLFGPFVSSLAIAFGFAIGAISDLKNKALERRIMSAVANLDALKTKA